jgi:hypothetical protein
VAPCVAALVLCAVRFVARSCLAAMPVQHTLACAGAVHVCVYAVCWGCAVGRFSAFFPVAVADVQCDVGCGWCGEIAGPATRMPVFWSCFVQQRQVLIFL